MLKDKNTMVEAISHVQGIVSGPTEPHLPRFVQPSKDGSSITISAGKTGETIKSNQPLGALGMMMRDLGPRIQYDSRGRLVPDTNAVGPILQRIIDVAG